MGKLQKLQDNTNPNNKKDCFNITPNFNQQTVAIQQQQPLITPTQIKPSQTNLYRDGHRSSADGRDSHHRHHSAGQSRSNTGPSSQQDSRSSSELLASPQGRYSYRLPSCSDASSSRADSHKYCRHTQGKRVLLTLTMCKHLYKQLYSL